MDTREWTTVDKATWGPGPWLSEPDKRQWPDEATGLPCLMVRNPGGGNWCGYVGVAEGHPAFGLNYYHSEYEAKDEGRALTPVHEAINEVRVHGGLTFADKCHPSEKGEEHGICHIPDEGEPDHVWWFGFDCAHSGDETPGRNTRAFWRDATDQYRDAEYVANECRRLARQLKALT